MSQYDEITVRLTSEAKFSLHKAQSKYPNNSDDKLVSEALERAWPTDESDRDAEGGEENSHLSPEERTEVEELQDNLNMFG